MKSGAQGKNTSGVEVSKIAPHGFWLLLEDEELLVPFKEFPWFEDAPIAHVANVDRLSPRHLYWPDPDIDLSVDSIRNPERFPLISKPMP